MSHRSGWCLVLASLAAWTSTGRADQFEQLDGSVLTRALKGADVTPRPSLTVPEIAGLPALFRDTRSTLILARTDLGNPVRLLVVPELRKPASGQGDLIPVVVLERLDTFDASDPSTRIATRRDIVVFDGFQVDLDTGQVVPEGQGGDLVFRSGGDRGPRLQSVGSAELFSLAKAPNLDASKPAQPTPGKVVVPGDFAGRYRIFSNGQLSGTLDLKLEGRKALVGQFRSDLHGTAYGVSGQVDDQVENKLTFAIKYPRARQEFEGFLWADGKGAIAGVAYLNLRPAGFFAIREGGKYAPEGSDLGPLGAPDGERPGRHVVEVVGDKLTLDARPLTPEELGEAIKALVAADSDPKPWVLIRTSGRQAYADVLRAAEAIQAAGIRSIRFGLIEGEK